MHQNSKVGLDQKVGLVLGLSLSDSESDLSWVESFENPSGLKEKPWLWQDTALLGPTLGQDCCGFHFLYLLLI